MVLLVKQTKKTKNKNRLICKRNFVLLSTKYSVEIGIENRDVNFCHSVCSKELEYSNFHTTIL